MNSLIVSFKVRKTLFLFLLAIQLVACSGDKATSEASTSDTTSVLATESSIGETDLETQPKLPLHPKRYGVRDGKLVYHYTGMQTGEEEVYFIHHGMTEVKFTETKRDNPFIGKEEPISMITLMRDSNLYVVDRSTYNAKKIDNTLLYTTAEQSPTLDLNEVAEKMYVEQGGKLIGIDTILGLPAKHWSIPKNQSEEWRWKGILLKMRVSMEKGYIQVKATSIDTTSEVPLKKFELPKQVNLTDGMSMEEWIEDLSKPLKRRQVFNKQGELVN